MTMIWMTCWGRIEMARLEEERRRSGLVGGIWVLRKGVAKATWRTIARLKAASMSPGACPSIHPASQPAYITRQGDARHESTIPAQPERFYSDQRQRKPFLLLIKPRIQRLRNLHPPEPQPRHCSCLAATLNNIHLQLLKFLELPFDLATIPLQSRPQPRRYFRRMIRGHVLPIQHEVFPFIRSE